jgi:hypothetical protein
LHRDILDRDILDRGLVAATSRDPYLYQQRNKLGASASMAKVPEMTVRRWPGSGMRKLATRDLGTLVGGAAATSVYGDF